MKLKIPNKEIIFFGVTIAGIAACIIFQCIILQSIGKINTELYAEDIEAASTVDVSAKEASELSSMAIYRLYECGGKIGIYDAKSDVIIDVIDIFVTTLPKSDRESLKKGIEIHSFAELSKIIDDLST